MLMSWLRGSLAGCAAAAVLAACSGMAGGDPVSRRLAWFDYVAGADLERACAASIRDRYRLVFNADFKEQVRTYDLSELREGALMEARVFRGSLQADRAFPSAIGGLLGRSAETALSPAEWRAFEQAVAQEGLFEPPDAPRYLRSDAFYWVVTACVGGRFFARGHTGPPAQLERLAFREILLRNDPTGVPVRVQEITEAARATDFGRVYRPMRDSADRAFDNELGPFFQFRADREGVQALGG